MQAMLRLRLLQRGVAANDQPRQKSTASEVNNSQPHGYAIMQLRFDNFKSSVNFLVHFVI